jgi:hypothetical protein
MMMVVSTGSAAALPSQLGKVAGEAVGGANRLLSIGHTKATQGQGWHKPAEEGCRHREPPLFGGYSAVDTFAIL